jgi:glutathione synthase/RimK-type ligase-like ATP-grasp enzyme
MNYILLDVFGKPSINKISRLMQKKHKIIYVKDLNKYNFTKNDVIIRWATQKLFKTNHAKIINLSIGIKNASNKALARSIFQENNISCPKTFFIGGEILFPAIFRPPYHRKGESFFIINNQIELNHLNYENDWYASSIIEKTNEYRVHVGHGKVLLIHEKPLKEGEIRGNQAITGLPWGNVLPWIKYKKNLCKLACDAVKILKLDMGAVDIIKGKDKKYYVLEVNTAPTLNDSPYSCKRYAKYFDWIFNHSKENWWNYNQYTIGKSFAWTNNQLES